jgi:hypothetical protein
MIRLIVVAGVALLLAFTEGAGWNRTAQAAPDSPLAAALLAQDELPAGWTVAGPLSADAGVPFTCPTRGAASKPDQRIGELLVDGSGRQMAYQSVSTYQTGGAEQVLGAASAESAPCRWLQPMDDTATAEAVMSGATPAPFGDDSAQRQLEMRDGGMVIEGDMVAVRCGDRLTQLTVLTLGRDASPQDANLTRALAQAAVHKICPTNP